VQFKKTSVDKMSYVQ